MVSFSVTEIQEAFVVFDQNRDGEITKEELGAVLYALGQRPTVTEVQALIRSVDLDSMYLSFYYFCIDLKTRKTSVKVNGCFGKWAF